MALCKSNSAAGSIPKHEDGPSQDSQTILNALQRELGLIGDATDRDQVGLVVPGREEQTTTVGQHLSFPTRRTQNIGEPSRRPSPFSTIRSHLSSSIPDSSNLNLRAVQNLVSRHHATLKICTLDSRVHDNGGRDRPAKSGKKQITTMNGANAPPNVNPLSDSHDANSCSTGFAADLDDSKPIISRGGQITDIPASMPMASKTSVLVPAAAMNTVSHRSITDISQQTPTQVNEDRDYDNSYDVSNSSHEGIPDGHDEHTFTGPQTLHADDTGAVNFDNLSPIGRPSSQVSEDGGFETTKGGWRTTELRYDATFTPFKARAQAPETPALPKNPFGQRPNLGGAPLGASQMFGQTQFSSVAKRISPTSSRPSPHLFLNSISPNVMETSPLKNRANVSSPTDMRTSSPININDLPDTAPWVKDLEPILEQTSSNERAIEEEERIPESPTLQPRSSASRQPLAQYVSMHKSQERKGGESLIDLNDSESDDVYRKVERRYRAQKKREKASRELEKVRFASFQRRESCEEPLRKRMKTTEKNNERPSQPLQRADSRRSIIEKTPSSARDSQGALKSSMDALPALAQPTASVDDATTNTNLATREKKGVGRVTEYDVIPETSPAEASRDGRSRLPRSTEDELPELPELLESHPEEDMMKNTSGKGLSAGLTKRRPVGKVYGNKSRRPRNTVLFSSSTSEPITPSVQAISDNSVRIRNAAGNTALEAPGADVEPDGANGMTPNAAKTNRNETPSSDVNVPPDSTTPTPIRPGKIEGLKALMVNKLPVGQNSPTTCSTLTSIRTTPSRVSNFTSVTHGSPFSSRALRSSNSSPTKDRAQRRGLPLDGAPDSPRPITRAFRISTRISHVDSCSTDELQESPSRSAYDKAISDSKSGRMVKYWATPVQRSGRLFEGMVFGLSFQASKAKQQEREQLEAKIVQAGGTILEEGGFQSLFEPSTIMNTTSPVLEGGTSLKLTKTGLESGFTALIADSHSRKAKYMQALALGLPCLAHQWINACLSKSAIVDWEPYLLCAGPSAILGKAIRSRTLTPYSAVEARLYETVASRPRLLAGQSLLVVFDNKRSKKDDKEPYIFLAQALGPLVSRVFTTQQARDACAERLAAGTPFNWLYVDGATCTVDSVLTEPDKDGVKKSKRSRVGVKWAPWADNLRVLNDEVVIQSLILGRMIEESELGMMGSV